jgi:hypothetical protein
VTLSQSESEDEGDAVVTTEEVSIDSQISFYFTNSCRYCEGRSIQSQIFFFTLQIHVDTVKAD